MGTPPPLLNYAAPKLFYDGTYRYRSWNGALSASVLAGVGVALLVLRHNLRRAAGPPLWLADLGLGVLGVAAMLGTVVTLAFMIQGRERPARVTEHGITHGRKHWPWVRIARFGGMKYTNGIAITFRLRGRGHATRTLYTTPLLTMEQFVELARTVKAFAAETNTNLHVAEEPEVPTSD